MRTRGPLFLLLCLALWPAAACSKATLLPDGYNRHVFAPSERTAGWPDSGSRRLMTDGGRLVPPEGPLRLDDCIRLAISNNLQVAMADNRIELAGSQITRAWMTAFMPTLSLTGNASYRTNDSAVEFMGTEFVFSERWAANAAARADFNLFSFGRTPAGLDYTRRLLDAARAGRRATEQQIVRAVIAQYLGVLTLRRGVELLEATIETVQRQATDARAFVEQELVTENEALVAEAELARQQQALREARTAGRLAIEQLNLVCGLAIERETELADIPPGALEPPDVEETLPIDVAVQMALRHRPELTAKRMERDAAGHREAFINRSLLPSLTAFVEYRVDADPNLVNPHWLTLGAQLQWVFLDATRMSDLRDAGINRAYARLELSELERQAVADVRAIWLRLRDSRSAVATAGLRTQQAEENLRILRDQFRAGAEGTGGGTLVTSADVLEATALLAAARRDAFTARYDEMLAWSELELATGIRLNTYDWTASPPGTPE